MLSATPSLLKSAEFSRLRFHLEFQDSAPAGAEILLRLRRDLRKAGRQILGGGERFAGLFDPPLAADPVARRRFQRPGPPFVILPTAEPLQELGAGDVFPLQVIFWGEGRQRLADFIRVLEKFGLMGIHRGEGRFELLSVEGEDPAGTFGEVWRAGENAQRLAPPVSEAAWWLEAFIPTGPLRLEFLTPARLITGGRPLFRPTFRSLFPFILRRVTSMLHAHCGLEPLDNPRLLVARSADVVEEANHLLWRDWRLLEGESNRQELGGITGHLLLDGPALDDLRWILGLGSLLNLGKGAAFAAGHYTLKAA